MSYSNGLRVIHPKAKIGKNVHIGPFTVIEEDVVIGDDCWIGSNVIISNGARIGDKCKIFPGAVISAIPQDLKYKGEATTLELGRECIVRECCTLNRGTINPDYHADGRTTIRAIRLTTPLRLDGAIDEAVYTANQPFSDYIQMEPRGGDPATEKTEGWIMFDDRNVYVAMRAYESAPDRMIVNEMRRDSNNIRQGDSLGFSFDTFLDKRNAVQFEVNVLGGRTDGQSTNERQYNGDWNPVWRLWTSRFDGGWSIEAMIPFKSLRYNPGRQQVWGFQSRRVSKWKNEISYVTRVPPALGMGRADFSASLYATIVGIEAPEEVRIIRGELQEFPLHLIHEDSHDEALMLQH